MATKERDNTWLQLQVCPAIWRQRDEENPEPCVKDSACLMAYAHPPTHVLKQALEAGFVVSCQAYVFATYAPDDGNVHRQNCRRGETNCKYFHPPEHLSLQVINMGRNNKRMKSEMLSKMKMQYQQQQAAVYAAPAFNPLYSWPYSMLSANPTVASPGLAANGLAAAAAAAAIPRPIPTIPTTLSAPAALVNTNAATAELRNLQSTEESVVASLRKRRSRSPSTLQSASGYEKSPDAKRRSKDEDIQVHAQALQQVPSYYLPYTSATATAGGYLPHFFSYPYHPFYDPRYQQ